MPNKAGVPCRDKGCPGIVLDGVCNVCGKSFKRDKNYDSARGTARDRGYDSRWEKVRRMYLAKYPLCQRCESFGRVTVATEVHHLIPVKAGGLHEEENLKAVCHKCHMMLEAELRKMEREND